MKKYAVNVEVGIEINLYAEEVRADVQASFNAPEFEYEGDLEGITTIAEIIDDENLPSDELDFSEDVKIDVGEGATVEQDFEVNMIIYAEDENEIKSIVNDFFEKDNWNIGLDNEDYMYIEFIMIKARILKANMIEDLTPPAPPEEEKGFPGEGEEVEEKEAIPPKKAYVKPEITKRVKIGENKQFKGKVLKEAQAEEGKLRVWWVRNAPNNPNYYWVKDVEEAKKILKQLAAQDLKNKFINDNGGGLEVYEDGEWTEWYDENGDDIDTLLYERKTISKTKLIDEAKSSSKKYCPECGADVKWTFKKGEKPGFYCNKCKEMFSKDKVSSKKIEEKKEKKADKKSDKKKKTTIEEAREAFLRHFENKNRKK